MANYLTLVEQLSTAVDQLNEVLQGDENTTVTINGQQQPSVQKKTLDEVNAKIQLVLDAAADIDAVKYATTTAGIAATADGQFFSVVSDSVESYLDLYKNESGVAIFYKSYPSHLALSRLESKVLSPSSANLLDMSKKRVGKYVSPGLNAITSSPNYQCTNFVKIEEGETYTVSGFGVGSVVALFSSMVDDSLISLNTGTGSTVSGYTFTVPIGSNINYVVVNITGEGADIDTYDSTAQIEKGRVATQYATYGQGVSLENIIGLTEKLNSTLRNDDVLESGSINLIDPLKIDYVNRYSEGSKSFTVDTIGIAATDWIPVEEGKAYTVSGSGIYSLNNIQAGYFTEYGQITAIDNVETNGSKTFSVPEGLNIKYVVICLAKLNLDPSATELTGNVQLQKGSEATKYEEYNNSHVIIESLLPNNLARLGDLLKNSSHNLVNLENINYEFRYSSGSKVIIADNIGIASTDYIKIEEGETYTVSGNGVYSPTSIQAGYFNKYGETTAIENVNAVYKGGTSSTFTVPHGKNIKYIVISLRKFNQDPSAIALDGNVQLEIGLESTEYRPYLPTYKIKDEYSTTAELRDELIKSKIHNLIDPLKIDYVNRYSEGSKSFTVDTIGIAATDWIPVEEGEFYSISGDGVYGITNIQGGYFTEYGQNNALQNIDDFQPPAAVGRTFQVPVGLGITHVVISLAKLGGDSESAELKGSVQLEKGEMPTPYKPHGVDEFINPDLLLNYSENGSPQGINNESWYKYTEGDEGQYHTEKLPIFRRHWLLKDKDLVVVNTGTSLTARSSEHCTPIKDESLRPPLMHSNNMASILWDAMKWDNQHYRRYDAINYFSEVGSFSRTTVLPEWDDGIYRAGLTRYSNDNNVSVTFEVPEKAWQFNFIYRTDSLGCDSKITISQGSGLMEVLDADGSWVEANEFIFSMKEEEPVARVISVPNASTDAFSDLLIPSKSNTTYQKRLKMRCKSGVIDSRATVKNMTISSNSAGRFMYWGVEWSPREFMITYINAARGSHNTQADQSRGLPKFADNEVWSFKPDLMFFELPIHNDGAAGITSGTEGIWKRLTNNYVFRTDYELSMKARAAHFGLDPEIAMFTSSIAINFGGIDQVDGNLLLSEQQNGALMTALDKYNEAYSFVIDHHPEAVFINSAKRWVDAGNAIFGNLKTATEGSGKDGATFTNEGSHWNDTGSKIIAKTLTPVFKFI